MADQTGRTAAPSPSSSRGNPRMGDIIRSVLVLGAIVLAVWGFGQMFTVTPDRSSPGVDYRFAAEGARDALDYPVLAPVALPKDGRASFARVAQGDWEMGVVTADDEFIGLYESTDKAALFERFVAKGAPQTAQLTVPAQSTSGQGDAAATVWTGLEPLNSGRVYSRDIASPAGPDVTVVVVSTADQQVVEDFLYSLSDSPVSASGSAES